MIPVLLKDISPGEELRQYVRKYQVFRFIFDKEVTPPVKFHLPKPEHCITFYVKDVQKFSYLNCAAVTEIYEVEAVGWNFRPRGIVHSFWNASEKPLRFIDYFFNQNFEDYLEDLFHKIIPDIQQRNLNPATPEIAGRIAALDKKFGVTWFHDQRQDIIDKYQLQG